MLIQLSSLVLTPVAFAYSRYQEHEADRFALDLTHDESLRRHGVREASGREPEQSPAGPHLQDLPATHPSIGERIDFCNSYHPSASRARSRTSTGDP